MSRRGLGVYDPAAFPPFAVTTDLALFSVFGTHLQLLLVRRGVAPFAGSWALPGGFVRLDEDADAAAVRELAEETGLNGLPPGAHLEQLATYSAPDRDPRMRVVSVAYVALLAASDLPRLRAGTDAAEALWWPVAELAAGDGPALAFDHARVVDDALERVRSKLEYTTLAASLLDEPFTIARLRQVYEAVWGTTLDASNFRRKVASTPGFVVEVGRTAPSRGRRGRPAPLYRRGDAHYLHPPLIREDRS